MSNILQIWCVIVAVTEWELSHPHPEEALRFPPLCVVEENIRFAEQHQEWLTTRNSGDLTQIEQALLDTWKWECRICLGPWYALCRAQRAGRTEQRVALRELRDRIGWINFSRGYMPPHFPIYHFDRR